MPDLKLDQTYPNLDCCLSYVMQLHNAGVKFQASRVYADRFKKSPSNYHLMFLGVGKNAHNVCQKFDPTGEWRVEIEGPGTIYQTASVLFTFKDSKTEHYRASAWYTKYLPYAYAMMKAEHGFKCDGVDYESINSYYATCMGFAYLAEPDDRICEADRSLYRAIAETSNDIMPCSLPFEEVHRPALCYVAARAPHLLARHTEKDHWQWQHACKVLEELKLPIPKYSKRKA
jgi:hypothetical protein